MLRVDHLGAQVAYRHVVLKPVKFNCFAIFAPTETICSTCLSRKSPLAQGRKSISDAVLLAEPLAERDGIRRWDDCYWHIRFHIVSRRPPSNLGTRGPDSILERPSVASPFCFGLIARRLHKRFKLCDRDFGSANLERFIDAF